MDRNIKRRLIAIVTVVALVAAAGLVTLIIALNDTPRSRILKIYNWEDYIETDLIQAFEDDYYARTGERIKVEYHTFADNEELYSKIKTQKADYDIAVPSEYMVEKMHAEGLLKPIDTDRISYEDEDGEVLTYDEIMDPALLERTRAFSEIDGQTWSIPYMIGTLGIMYDTNVIERMGKQTVEEFEDMLDEYGWGVLFGAGDSTLYQGHVTMKKSARDTIGIAMLYYAQDQLTAAVDELNAIVDKTSEAYQTKKAAFDELINNALNMKGDFTLDMAAQVLREQIKTMNPTYESEDGKLSFQSARNQYAYGLYWSSDAGLVMYEDDDTLRENIKFYIPKNGTNLWTDNIVLPKYGKNEDAAYAFINFMLNPENAATNIEYVGSTMGVGQAIEDLREDWHEDDNDWMDNYIDAVFPPDYAVNYGAIMHNFSADQEDAVNELLITIMKEAANDTNWLLIIWAVVLVLAAGGIGLYFILHRRPKA